MTVPAALLLALLATLSTAAPRPASAQETAATTETSADGEAPAETALAAISTSDIATQAKTTLARLRAAESLALPVRDVERIADSLSTVRAGIQEAGVFLARLAETRGSFRQLELARTRWQGAAERLSGWSERLAKRSNTLATTRQALLDTISIWTRTRDALDSGEVPAALVDNVDQVLAQASKAEDAVHRRLNEILVLQAEITEMAAQTNQGQEEVDRLMLEFRRQILVADSAPLWQVLARPGSGNGLLAQVRAVLRNDREALELFVGENGFRPLLHFLLLCLSLAAVFTLRSRSQKWDLPDADRLAATHILGRPLSTSLILTLMMTPLIYSQVPPVVYELNRMLLVVPVLRLVPGLLVRASRRPLFLIAGLYLVDNLVGLTEENTLLQRMLLLASTLAALGAGVWIARREISGHQSGPAAGLLRRLVYLSVLIMGTAAVANLLGNVSLASLLSSATLTSAYGAYILFAITQVLGILISVLLHSRTLKRLHSLSDNTELVRGRAEKLLNALAAATWLAGTLYFFGLLGTIWDGITTALSWTWSLGSLQISLGSILAFALTIWVSVLLSQLIRFVLMEDVMPRLPLARGMPSSISQLLHYAIISLGFLAALGAAGIELSRFAIMAGALGVGIGFGLQNLVNNFVSGLILIFERPMQIGDKVEVGVHRGEVRRIGFRASTIRTFSGAEIIVPNGDLISKELTNWTLSDHMRRVDLPVGVAYGSDPEQVIKLLVDVARREPDVLDRPEPKAHFMEFGDSSLNFILRFWTPKFDEWWGVHSKILLGAHQALQEAGITIPFPQRDLHLRSVDAEAADELARRAPGPGQAKLES